MFSTCSEFTLRAPIPDGRMERFMHPSETKVVHTSGLFGLSSERLDAIEVGLKKLTTYQPSWSGIPQVRQVAREVVSRCQPEFSIKHTRRGNLSSRNKK